LCRLGGGHHQVIFGYTHKRDNRNRRYAMDAATQQSRRDAAFQVLTTWRLAPQQKDQLLAEYENVLSVLSIADSLLAIYEGDADRASRWPSRPNAAFGGQTPLEAMLSGDCERVRKYLKYHVYNA